MPRYVWLCTRPLSYASKIPELELSPNGRPYLRHWGVLVTDLPMADTTILFQSANKASARITLGTMYQLMQTEGRSDVFVDSDFSVERLRNKWRSYNIQYIGETELTHEMISEKGKACQD